MNELRDKFSRHIYRLQQTVLHYCATSRNKNVVQALLDAGADINAKDK
jgi:ankyrin repeat protein